MDKEDNVFENYYKKKGEYNKKLQTRIDKILVQQISKKEKRSKIKKIKLPCIFCKRPVNTLFENDNRMLIAKCGSNDNPCDSSIKIEREDYFLLENIIILFEELIEINKSKINRLKYQTLYSIISREKLSEKFKKIVNEYNENMECYITFLRRLNDIKEQKEKNELLSETLLQFENFVESIKLTIKQFNETKEIILLTDVITSQAKDIIPLIKKIRTLKYAHSEIISINEKDFIGDVNKNYLFTRNFPFESLEYKFENDEKNENKQYNDNDESDSESSSDND